ncbi:hypothetical protein D3C84_809720 [compost metagenome]
MFDVYGSNASLFPRICEVEAVGIGATNNELRTPCSITSFLNEAQSQRPDNSSSFIPHILYWNSPLDIGEPSNVEYGPSSFAISIEAVTAAKYKVSKISWFNTLASSLVNGKRNIMKASAKPCTPNPTGR